MRSDATLPTPTACPPEARSLAGRADCIKRTKMRLRAFLYKGDLMFTIRIHYCKIALLKNSM